MDLLPIEESACYRRLRDGRIEVSEPFRVGEIDVPVTFGGVTFRPGDTPFSEDGVVTLGPAA